MATKKKTRARTKAPAAEAPEPTPQTVAPSPAPAIVDPVGLRTNPAWSHRDKNPRPAGALDRTAVLVRGNNYVISYSNGPVPFKNGVPVRINESEFQRLSDAIDSVDFPDPSTGLRIRRSIRKFTFAYADTGDAIDLPALPDVECGPGSRDPYAEAERARIFEGSEHTAR